MVHHKSGKGVAVVQRKNLSKEQRRDLVLRVAAKKLTSGKFHWNAGITFEWLSLKTGIDIGRISKDFDGKKQFSKDLASYCLEPTEKRQEVIDAVTPLFQNMDLSIQELTVSIAKCCYKIHFENPEIHSRMFMFAVSSHDADVRRALATTYESWIDHLELPFRRWLEEKKRRGQAVDPVMPIRDFVLATVALLEGSVVIARTDPNIDPSSMFNRAILALVNGLHEPSTIDLSPEVNTDIL